MRAGSKIAAAAALAACAACAALAACAKKGDDSKGTAERRRATEPGAVSSAPAAPERARHHVLAEKLVAALASGDYASVEALRKKPTPGEARESLQAPFRKLRERLAGEKIELANASISRVETSGQDIEEIELFLAHNGRMFQLHFTAIASGGTYTLLGLADWVRSV